jgi:hypothetical protein
MRLRIRTRHDLSWPLGWSAIALEVAAILALIYATVVDHLGQVSPDPASWVIATSVWLGGGAAAVFTLLISPFTKPGGRGWPLALSALLIMFFSALFSLGGQGGVGG